MIIKVILTVDLTEKFELASVTLWQSPIGLERWPDGTWRVNSCDDVDILFPYQVIELGIDENRLRAIQGHSWYGFAEWMLVKKDVAGRILSIREDDGRYTTGVSHCCRGYDPMWGHEQAALLRAKAAG